MVYSKVKTRKLIQTLPKSILGTEFLRGSKDIYLNVYVKPQSNTHTIEAKFTYGNENTGYAWELTEEGELYFKVNLRYQVWKLYNKDKNYSRLPLAKLEPLLYEQINYYEQYALEEYHTKVKLRQDTINKNEDEYLLAKLQSKYPTLNHAMDQIGIKQHTHNKVSVTGVLVPELRGVKDEILLKLIAPKYVHSEPLYIDKQTGRTVITYYED